MSNGICPSPPPDYDSDNDNGEMIDVYYKERFCVFIVYASFYVHLYVMIQD